MAGKSDASIVLAILAAALLIAAAVIFTSTEFFDNIGEATTSNRDEYSSVRRAVAEQLLDPESVRFRNLQKAALGYCGEVNAKNRMGGYVGFKKFNAYQRENGSWKITYTKTYVEILCK